MLVILFAVPVTAPGKPIFPEQLIHFVVFVNHIPGILTFTFGFVTLGVCFAVGWLHKGYFSILIGDTGVYLWVDIDRQSLAVLRKTAASGNPAIIKGRGVVGRHGGFVIPIVVIHQRHALDWIFHFIEFIKYFQHFFRDFFIYN